MKTLSSPLTTAAVATQSGFTELYDIYLKSSITTPFGSTSTIRITNLPSGLTFFTPLVDPEPSGTQGNSQAYQFWPITRALVKSDAKSTNDKMTVSASNVSREWAQMLADVDWEDTPFVIRKVSHTIAVPTSADCAIVFIGQVDSVRITLDQIDFSLSSDLSTLSTIAPRENMHASCRFNWADDFCTKIRFHQDNYKSKTAGSSCTTTRIFSSGFTEDAAFTTVTPDAVTADPATDKITLTSHGLSPGDQVRFRATVMPIGMVADKWYYVWIQSANDFKLAAADVGLVDIQSTGTSVLMYRNSDDLIDNLSSGAIVGTSDLASFSARPVSAYQKVLQPALFFRTAVGLVPPINTAVVFSGSVAPTNITFGSTYYILRQLNSTDFTVASSVPGVGEVQYGGSLGSGFTFAGDGSPASNLRSHIGTGWALNSATDWGTESQGYWQIPSAQQGLANPLLKPYVTFDFGSAVQPCLWQAVNFPGNVPEKMSRLILIFSSADQSTWKHETYFELPPRGGEVFDILIPGAANKRYWRVCVRSRWAQAFQSSLLFSLHAFVGCRNYWLNGRITFASNTSTVALRNVTAKVLKSSYGEITVPLLPAAPANGDTFIIERGCGRTINDCFARQNVENFGGFTDLPSQAVIR